MTEQKKNINQFFSLHKLLAAYPLLVSFLLVAFATGLTYFFFTPHFISNDDPAMLLKVAGISKLTTPSAYMLYTHVFIGWILKSLYTLSLNFPWYGVYLSSCLALAYAVFFYIILRNNPSISGLLLCVLFYLLIGMKLMLSLQFTIVAAMVALAGISLLVFYPHEYFEGQSSTHFSFEKILTFRNIAGVLLIALGCMIRWRSMIYAIALALPVLAFYYYQKPFKIILRQSGLLAVGILLSALMYQVNQMAYSSAGWDHFLEAKPKAMKFINYGIIQNLPNEERRKIEKKIGWSTNDLNMFLNWFFMDEELYSIEKFDKALAFVPPYRKRSAEEVQSLMEKAMANRYFVNGLLMAIIGLLFFAFRWRNLLAIFAMLITIVLLFLYLTYYLKPPPQRVYFVAYAWLGVFPLLMLNRHVKVPLLRLSKQYLIQKILLFLLVIGLVYQYNGLFTKMKANSKNFESSSQWLYSTVKEINKNGEASLYVTWANSFPWKYITPFQDVRYLKDFRTFGLGTGQQSPESKQILNEFGIKNLYTALLQREDILLIIKNRSAQRLLHFYKEFVKEHYGIEAYAEGVATTNVFSVVKVYQAK